MRYSHSGALVLAFASLAVVALTPPSAPSQVKRSHSDEVLNAIGHRNLGKGTNFYSCDKEKELGKQLAHEVERSSKLIDDPIVTEYLSRLGQNLAKNSDAKFPITFRVVDSNEINAFTLPGGYQYVNRGLILATQSEAELAGVLAHGIAHTALRSVTTQATKSELMQLASIPAMIYIPNSWWGPGPGSALGNGLNLAVPLVALQFLREDVLSADFYGMQYLYKAGYNSEAYPSFIERVLLQKPQGKDTSNAFDPFPLSAERVKALREEIARLLPRRAAR